MYKKIYLKRYYFMSKTVQKIWPNKNSRLRFFYFKRYFFRYRFSISRLVRKYFVQRNMKWRKLRKKFFYLTANKKNKLPQPSKYKEELIWYKYIFTELLNEKQKFRAFFSIKKHKQLLSIYRKFFRKQKYFQKNIFLNSFESRLDIVLLRAKILPTLFSSRFLIENYGILVNGIKHKTFDYRLKPGDIVHFDFILWRLLIAFIYYKIFLRYEIFFFYKIYKNIKTFSKDLNRKKLQQDNHNYFSWQSQSISSKSHKKTFKISQIKNKKKWLPKNKFKKRKLLIKNKRIRQRLDQILGLNLFSKQRNTNHFESEKLNKYIYKQYSLLKNKYQNYLKKEKK